MSAPSQPSPRTSAKTTFKLALILSGALILAWLLFLLLTPAPVFLPRDAPAPPPRPTAVENP